MKNKLFRMIALILALASVVSFSAFAAETEPETVAPSVPGDVNGNGVVTNVDLVEISRYVVELITFTDEQIALADVNNDGKVSNSDILIVCDLILYKDPEIVARDDRLLAIYKAVPENSRYDAEITKYYGTYSDCEVAFVAMKCGTAGVMVYAEAAGYKFAFSDPAHALYVFKGSQCLRIDKAYEAGWITEEDVAALWGTCDGFFIGKNVNIGI